MENKGSKVLIQSVERAIQILNCFKRSAELGVSEIAAELSLNKSTAFGLINTLAAYGFLEQVDQTKKYRLGVRLFELGSLAISRFDVRKEAKELCMPLAEKYGVELHLASHSAGEVVYIDKFDRGDSLISSSNVGKRCPMHCTGVGKAMLAYLSREYLDRYVLSAPLVKLTEHTITEKDRLLEELADVKKSGIAVDREEIERGLTCVAAPIFNYKGEPQLAISLSFPYGKIYDADVEEVKADLLSCTRKLSQRLGGTTII